MSIDLGETYTLIGATLGIVSSLVLTIIKISEHRKKADRVTAEIKNAEIRLKQDWVGTVFNEFGEPTDFDPEDVSIFKFMIQFTNTGGEPTTINDFRFHIEEWDDDFGFRTNKFQFFEVPSRKNIIKEINFSTWGSFGKDSNAIRLDFLTIDSKKISTRHVFDEELISKAHRDADDRLPGLDD